MEPVRVKMYGLFSLTKRRYLTQQAAAVVMAMILLLVWSFVPRLDAPVPRAGPIEVIEGKVANQPRQLPPELLRLVAIFNAIPWVVAGMLLLIVMESVFVLRLFARKEAEQRAPAIAPPASDPAAAEPAAAPTSEPAAELPGSEQAHG